MCDLFDHQVRVRPEATAVRTAHRSWTYCGARPHDSSAGPPAAAPGSRPRDRRRAARAPCVGALTGIVATLRCGAACLPLTPDRSAPSQPRRFSPTPVPIRSSSPPRRMAAPAHSSSTIPARRGGRPRDAARSAAAGPGVRDHHIRLDGTSEGGRGPARRALQPVVASIEELDLIREDDVMLWTTAPTVDSTMQDCLMPLSSAPASRSPKAVISRPTQC